MVDIFCQNIQHSSQQIILYCLNKVCIKKQKACKDCVNQFHENHIEDCFTLSEMLFVLDEYLIKLKQVNIQLFHGLENELESIISTVELEKENLLNFAQRGETHKNIIETAFQCYNNHIYLKLVSLIFSQVIKQKEFKENYFQKCLKNLQNAFAIQTLEYKQKRFEQQGNRLFELNRFSECIIFYDCAIKIGNTQDQLILNIINSLNQIKKYEKALTYYKYTNSSQEKFANMMTSVADFALGRNQNILLKSKPFGYQLNQIHWGNYLVNMKLFELALQLINEVLNADPSNRQAIQIKLLALLKLGRFGELKEYIQIKLKDYPQEQQMAKFICFYSNKQYFSQFLEENIFNSEQFQTNILIPQIVDMILNFQKITMSWNKYMDGSQMEANSNYYKEVQISDQINEQSCYQKPIPKIFQILQSFLNRDFDGTLQLIEKLLEIYPSRILYLIKSQVLIKTGKLIEGLRQAKIGMYLGKRNDFCTRQFVIALILNKQYQKALSILEQIIDKDEYKFNEWKYKLLCLMENFEGAKNYLNEMQNFKINDKNYKNVPKSHRNQVDSQQISADNCTNDFNIQSKNHDQLEIFNNDIEQLQQICFDIENRQNLASQFDLISATDLMLFLYC